MIFVDESVMLICMIGLRCGEAKNRVICQTSEMRQITGIVGLL